MRYTYEQYVNLKQQKDTKERSQKSVQSTDCSYRSYGERLGAVGGSWPTSVSTGRTFAAEPPTGRDY